MIATYVDRIDFERRLEKITTLGIQFDAATRRMDGHRTARKVAKT
jgi:hypothetical protein